MNITNLETVVYGVEDIARSRQFWLDFGLRPASASEPVRFAAQDGSSVEIRVIDDPSLPPSIESGPTVRELVFGVTADDDLQLIADELAQDRDVQTLEDGRVRSVDPLGLAISFTVSQRRPVIAPQLKFNTPGRPDRLNSRGQFFESAKPLELTHAVYMVEDPESVQRFYVDRLGFVVTDCYPGKGYFMRCAGSNKHHNLFLLNAGGKRGFHHIAFELGNIHELFGGGLKMTKSGWKTALGPGRHPISSCYFWYFDCPSGGAAEYDFDSDIVDDNWVPGNFEQTPENFAEWCLAEGMQRSLLYRGIQTSRTARK